MPGAVHVDAVAGVPVPELNVSDQLGEDVLMARRVRSSAESPDVHPAVAVHAGRGEVEVAEVDENPVLEVEGAIHAVTLGDAFHRGPLGGGVQSA
ncbi:hypothetical protein HNR23_003456 [Nocardiopsis mwathae]|uniref:Uncharacterized protein n=1 Tax=Nocardiopsis mwathae TaxID=1472723 RepID=A0A7W9YLK5_9ACTN|nr:hypothetical protein [Nocardiopsis mwathae]MBB6173396.1 hypothetical protein [Nocardiopsis mwathae]